nr:dynein heavy chain 8, axonemal [Leptinotarsa decemlineata]
MRYVAAFIASREVHYDFGLRNILSVLRTLGAQKRANPNETEDVVVMRVLRDMNLSKLIDEDEPLFLSLIEDMFPGIKLTTKTWKDLQKAIINQCAEMGLVNYPSWNLKVIQLYETSLVRHGLMVLGPTGAGKTKCMSCLMRSMTETGLPHKELRMNPKAITAPQMFGRLDVATNDWTDGIFSTLWRRTLKFKKTDFCWLVLDGPVDAVWIENLNSVLDDNKTLTLANGDRIVMAANCKLVFEPDNVDNASPATVSRMGMVFMSSSVLPWSPILEAWLKTRSQQEADTLRSLFNRVYGDLHTFVQTRLKAKMFVREALYIRQCYDVLQGILDISDEPKVWTDKQLERLFLFSTMWSLGAILELDDRAKLEEFALAHPSKLDWPKCNENETIFEYVVNPENGRWEHWSRRVEEFVYPTDSILEFTSILVPNVDNVRTAFLIHTVAKQNKAVLLIGEQGTAKTVMIKGYTSTFDPEYKLNKCFNFSSATTPNMVQRIIESYVDKRVGTTYGPPAGKTLTIFIDDINMPVINDWGDQITNEIVRQCMESGGFYSLDKPGDFSYIVDVMFLAAMIHPGGGRNDIPHRLKRQFCVFNCTLPSIVSMDLIFKQIGCGYFCIERFTQEIVDFLPVFVPLTRHLWQNVKKKMLPTPAKFHYVFNLRDLSRIWQGILTVQNLECQTKSKLIKLWKHECTRVIADRCTEESDRTWFVKAMRTQAEEELGEDFQYYEDEDSYWVDFLREPPEATGDEPDDFSFEAPKVYEEIPSWEFLKEKLFSFMDQYNEAVRGATMDMVFFRDAMIHLMIISRIIRTARGNALLVGVGGSGKQSLTRLASFIANYKSFQIQLTRTYNVGNLMDDMKFLYRQAGLVGSGITFIFTDNEIKEETFLESLNNILSSGEIANLFAKDELDEIQSELIPVMKKVFPRRPPTVDNLYDFFLSRARSNLHVTLCFSPVGEKFRSRALKFPGLISGCTTDWFSKWPEDALIEVSSHFLMNYTVVATPDIKQELVLIMAEIQDGVSEFCNQYFNKFRRRTYVTPKTFISFLAAYKTLYKKKLDEIGVMAQRMKTGLKKLVEAQVSVDELRKELSVKEVEMNVATEKAEVVLNEVLAASEVANKIKEEALVVKERAENLVGIISVDQKEAEGKLMAAKPALDAAEQALLTIKAADIATVRKLGKPPYLITLIMDAVLIYFKRKVEPVKPDPDKNFLVPCWSESLKVMADSAFLRKLQEYPKDTINAETVDLLVPYFNYPQYTYEAAKTACGNVAGLISWTIAMAAFFDVNREVLPLKANLAIQQAKLSKAEEELGAAMELLRAKEEEVKECQDQYEQAMQGKQKIFEEAMVVKNKMDAATALINGLSGERIRWTDQLAQFKAETERLIGDVVLLTGFLGYTGPFNQEFRSTMQQTWLDSLIKKKIPVTLSLNIIDSLSDSATIGEWNLQGLPTDDLSIENGIIVTTASRYPLLIDPQSQGKFWIKEKEKDNQLIVTSLNHKYFRNHIEDSVSLGYPMIIEDIGEELDPVLDNVMEKNLIKLGTTYKVKVGDKEVDFNNNFRMYITTRLANPNYTPEIFARASIIDFTVTMKGLEDQLLGRVILTEKKELETERTNLIKDVTANKRKMLELEANLLYKLTTTQGSLLDDETVIGVLNVTKSTANEVKEKLTIAKDTEIKINLAREEFRPVAARGSVLYFLVVSMAMVNVMYQTSLVQFLERFDISMYRSEKTPIISKRISNIIEYLTYEIYKYKSRGLYEEHKYMLVLLMCLRIDLERENITHEEFQNFIKGGAALDLNACPPKPAKWITDMTWLNIVELSKLRHFQYIIQQVSSNDKQWKSWFDKDAPEEAVIPDGYSSLDTFRKLLLIRSWCPDRTITQSRKYIASSLGQKFAEPVILNMEVLFNESRPLTPMICFLSIGSDPTPYIEQLAKRLELKSKSISMGQGQEVHARKLMTGAMTEGYWALLQNCHLSLDYMNEVLGQFLELEKGIGSVHPDFRLWITTEVTHQFPISLLQICIKFTNEAPSGIRAGLLRTYSSMNQDLLDYSDAWQYIPLVYAISFLHTVVQERRKFGPLGWNIPYEFNSADWLSSVLFLQNHLDDIDPKRGISWQTLRYMLGEVHYGGRVTDDFDKVLLNTFCRVWFSDNVFHDDFIFYKGYKIFKFKNTSEYVTQIDGFATTDPPQAYGLHSNADITYQTNTTVAMFDQMLAIQPKESGGGGGESRESVVGSQAKDMLSKLPNNYDPFEVKERLRAMNLLNPLNIFLRQEIDRMQKVITLVRATLRDLLLAIEGTIIMSEALGDALDNIYDAKVPGMWLRGSWAASSLGFWFTELVERDTQFRTWCFSGRPASFWMAGFFNPQGFLTAMKQEVARAHKGWALDQVTLFNEVTKNSREEVTNAPPEGVLVYGLFLDGAGWDRRLARLAESINKVLYTLMPVIHIFAVYSTDPKPSNLYVCPVYKKSRRTGLNFIVRLYLNTAKPPEHWTLRGAALLCDIQ